MTETTRDIILTFCENAKLNAVKLGAVQCVKFTREGIIVEGRAEIKDSEEMRFLDFSEISAGFSLHQIVRMLRSVSDSAEGTAVVFIHGSEQDLTERLASMCGFRVCEHFSVTRVVRVLCCEAEDRDISYCMAVKK